jgi:hypothetical protein
MSDNPACLYCDIVPGRPQVETVVRSPYKLQITEGNHGTDITPYRLCLTIEQARDLWVELGAALQSFEHVEAPAAIDPTFEALIMRPQS